MYMTVVALLDCQLSLVVVVIIIVGCPSFGRSKERTTSMVSIKTVRQLVLQI